MANATWDKYKGIKFVCFNSDDYEKDCIYCKFILIMIKLAVSVYNQDFCWID